MCGIVGIFNTNEEPVAPGLLQRMTDVIAHRGPDGEGQYIDGTIGLGHRRLAIIDLSPAGQQPMANETGDVIVTYNGELYNFQKLRVELESVGHHFHSRTDTEVIVHGYEEWGPQCVERFNGMFAFAVWDAKCRNLFLARDRFGIKPLYWFWRDGTFLFASEIKSLLQHPAVGRNVCLTSLNEYFTFQNIFSDRTLFEGVRLLPPGSSLTLDSVRGPRLQRFWDYPCHSETTTEPIEECAEQLQGMFQLAVTRQLVSDVPIGAYLSGGIDSGSITAVAARHVPRLTTFTAGFDLSSASGLELSFDERAKAEVLANLLKTEHYEVVLHAGDMENVLPQLIWHLEDLRVGQCYPNYYVARLASKFVKAVLSGAGGDELFGGYPWRYYRGVGSNGRDDYYDRYYKFWQRLIPDEDKPHLFNAETRRRLGDHSTFDEFREVFRDWQGSLRDASDFINASLYFEIKTFLHGLLVVEDKLSMAHGLETRVPFLDNDIVDFAARLPAHYKLLNLSAQMQLDENSIGKRHLFEAQTSDGKAILRRAMQGVMPRVVTDRVKQGFSAPDASWFRGESIDYINKLLRHPKARINDFFNPAYVAGVLDEHCSGRVNRRLLIWSLLSFEWWCRCFLDNPPATQTLDYRTVARHDF